MFVITFAMVAVLAVTGLVVTYVAFPHRGTAVPGAPWLGAAMTRGVESLPTLNEDEGSNRAH